MEKRILENKSGRAMPDSQEVRVCATCGKDFVAWSYLTTKYCSLDCRSTQRRKYGKKTCAFCGKVVERPSGKFGRYENEFCSVPCEARYVQRVAKKREHYQGHAPSSKYKGVSYNKRRKKYVVFCTFEGVRHYLGAYSSEIDAALAYNAAARKFFGEMAFQNEIPTAAVSGEGEGQ